MLTRAFIVPVLMVAVPAQAITPTTGSVEYEQGVATVTSDMANSSVRLIPQPKWNGRYAFRVAVVNDGQESVNVGAESVTINGQPAMTMEQMASVEKRKAFWQSVAIAALAAGAGALADGRRTTITTRTPRGSYRTVIRGPSNNGSFVALGALGMGARQLGLRRTLADMGDAALLATTIHPGESYGGFVVAPKMKAGPIVVRVSVGPDVHVFNFTEDK